MEKIDLRLEILDQARRSLRENSNLSHAESEEVLKLINVLIETSQQNSDSKTSENVTRGSAVGLLQNQVLRVSLQQQTDELDALKKLSLNLTSSLDLHTVLEAVVTEAMHLMKDAQSAHIFLYTKGKLEFGASLNQDGTRNVPFSTPRSRGLTDTVAQSGKEIIVEDITKHPLYQGAPQEWTGSIVGIPLKINNNIVGVMNLSRSTIGGFTPLELSLLGLLADQAAVAISNASLHQLVSKQAYSDTVTGLPNRRALDERLEKEVFQARRTNYTFAVVMMDLDGFKDVNDTYGHAVGDQVLRTVFNYLATGLRSTDFLARYGGDELTLILSQTDQPAARLVVEKILEKINKFHFDTPNGGSIRLGLSAGISLYPIHAATASDLLRSSDEALYHAKRHNRGSFTVARGFTGGLNPQVK